MLALELDTPATIAGAFILGATLGTFAAIRVMRAVLDTFDRPRRRRRDADDAQK